MRQSNYHPAYWTFVARACAEKAHTEFRSTRRGVLHVEEEDVLVFFDNVPPRGSMRARERAVARLGEHLDGAGIRLLATATFPHSGPDDGLSLAVVLDAGVAEEATVTAAWEKVCREDPFPNAGGAR